MKMQHVTTLMPDNITVIITTYQRPTALHIVLQALAVQSEQGFDVCIADDGSGEETATYIKNVQARLPYTITHIWHPDQGFRAASIRNQAILRSTGEYLIFLDGDSAPAKDFMAQHRALARAKHFVTGNRVLCNQTLTHQIEQQQENVAQWSLTTCLLKRLRGQLNRFLPLLRLPLPLSWRLYKQDWRGAKTCNFAVWKQDLIAVNGFDERYQGWGHEDADLAVRLLREGVKRISGQYAVPIFHLWHPDNDRSQESGNRARLAEVINAQHTRAVQGLAEQGAPSS